MSSVLQGYLNYRREVANLNLNLDQVGVTHLEGLENSLWNFDSRQIEVLLRGIIKIPNVVHAEVLSVTGDRYSAGSSKGIKRFIVREFRLMRGEDELGILRMTASLDAIYEKLWFEMILIFLNQFFVVFVFSLLILWLFSRRVTRHLWGMARYASGLSVDRLDEELVLERVRSANNKRDELDLLVESFNRMRLSLREDIEARKMAEDEVRRLNLVLEKRVEERTFQLEKANEELRLATEAAQRASQAKSVFFGQHES